MAKPKNMSWRKGIRKEKPIIKTESAESLLNTIRDRIAQGHQIGILLHLLNRWLKIQLRHGRSLDAIATGLNSAGIPTLSGAGQWRADTVQYLTRRLPQSAQVKRPPAPGKGESG